MAADTFNETENSPDESPDESPSLLAVNPPRPPRPAKRASGRARVPMPAPRARLGAGAEDLGGDDHGEESAPASSIHEDHDEPVDDPEFPLVASRAKQPSANPEESFEDLDADLADRAPRAPVTPWRHVPVPVLAPVAAPQRRELESSPAVEVDEDEERIGDREDTIVGEVPRNLLELSSSGDENTQAYTAPQELIELAKRKREERAKEKKHQTSPEAHSRETERPPAQRRAAAAKDVKDAKESAPAVPKSPRVASNLKASPAEEDSAPAVARTISGEMPAVSASERAPESAAPPVKDGGGEFDLGPPSSELSASAPLVRNVKGGAELSPESVAMSLSSYKTPWFSSTRCWLLIAGLFIVIGVALARWRGLEQLLLQ